MYGEVIRKIPSYYWLGRQKMGINLAIMIWTTAGVGQRRSYELEGTHSDCTTVQVVRRRARFDLWLVHVGFVVDEIVFGQVYLPVFQVFLVNIISTKLHTHQCIYIPSTPNNLTAEIFSKYDTLFSCTKSPSGPRPPCYRGLTITLRHTTVGRTPLDEWSFRRRDFYLTAHNSHNKQTSMLPSGIRPHNPSKRAATELRRPRDHWDHQIEHFAHVTDTIPYYQTKEPTQSCRVSYVSFFS